MKPRLSEFSLRYMIVRELSQLPTFRSGYGFDLFHDHGSWKAIPFILGTVDCSDSFQKICSRLRSKFDLQVRHSEA
jgi:hypothetical protein